MGAVTQATGQYSTAMGFGSIASDFYATAMGSETVASGTASTAAGSYTTAKALGTSTREYQMTTPTTHLRTHPLRQIVFFKLAMVMLPHPRDQMLSLY